MPPDQHPNILLIMTDQQSAESMNNLGNPYLSTPAMDRLAAEGVRFTQAYCTSPVCVPSRTSLFYGRMPHEILLPGTETDMNPDLQSPRRGVIPRFRQEELGQVLGRAGYDCVYAGKWHVGTWGPTESLPDTKHPYGFRKLCSLNDPQVPRVCRDYFQAGRNQPFFMVASFDNPHNICEWKIDQTLPWGNLPEPPALSQLPPLPANFEPAPYEPAPLRLLRQQQSASYTLTPDDWRRYRWAYYRLVEKVDREIGRVLTALHESGLDDHTLVIFTSDHGDMQSAHRLMNKSVMYDEAVKMPFMVRGPGVQGGGRTETRLVSSGLDIYATACDFAGAETPVGMNGRSLRPLLAGSQNTSWRPFVVSEIKNAEANALARMVRTDRYKYVVYSKGPYPEQLFDLEQDPGEMVNLAVCGRHGDTLRQHREYLRAWFRLTQDRFNDGHYTHPQTSFLIPGDEYEPC